MTYATETTFGFVTGKFSCILLRQEPFLVDKMELRVEWTV